MILPSRNYPSADAFADDFFASLTPGIIPRSGFINWEAIEQKLREYKPAIEFFSDLRTRELGPDGLAQEISDSLLSADNPRIYLAGALRILGHTSNGFVTRQDDIKISDDARLIQSGDETTAKRFAELILDLGFQKILARDDLEDVLFGVQIGLETHRRKNTGGKKFTNLVKPFLEAAVEFVNTSTNKQVTISPEKTIFYGNGLSKTVDFALEVNELPRFGIEINFYTGTGSKPTEIKRSYGDIRRGFDSVGVEVIWITDGSGYRAMRHSLRDAYLILPNIYNLKQVQQHLANDLIIALTSESSD